MWLQIRDFASRYNTFSVQDFNFNANTTGIVIYQASGLDYTMEERLEQLNHFAMNDDHFDIVKDFTMKCLTVKMTNSSRFAKLVVISLLKSNVKYLCYL